MNNRLHLTSNVTEILSGCQRLRDQVVTLIEFRDVDKGATQVVLDGDVGLVVRRRLQGQPQCLDRLEQAAIPIANDTEHSQETVCSEGRPPMLVGPTRTQDEPPRRGDRYDP